MEIPPIELNPEMTPRFSVIWLHGLGADGNDFVPVVTEMDLPPELAVRFVFPNAPSMPVSINNGYVMPAWCDIVQPDLAREVDREGILRSVTYLQSLVRAEAERGIPPERVVVAGFSQGGVVALTAALRSADPLAGVMALSTYLPLETEAPSHHDLEIFQGHGRMDNVVPYPVGLDTRHRLEQFGHRVTWREYDIAHSVNLEEIADIREWLIGICAEV